MNFTPGHWLMGWILAAIIICVGAVHGWTLVWIGGIIFSGLWWYAPEILTFFVQHSHHFPPEEPK